MTRCRKLLLAAAILLSMALAAPAEGPRLRLLTYDIHHGQGADGRFDLPRIAKVIMAQRPDLVALQEVDVRTGRAGGIDQAAALARLCGLHGAFGAAMDYNGGQYGEAVLSRFPILETVNHPLPAPSGYEPRAALAVRIRPEGFTADVWFVGTHLDHLSSQVRVDQAQRILAALPAAPQGVLLAGDLNAQPDSPTMRHLLAHFHAAAVPGEPTCPADTPRVKIDYLLFRPASAWRVLEAAVVNEQVASDHRPLSAVLQWTASP